MKPQNKIFLVAIILGSCLATKLLCQEPDEAIILAPFVVRGDPLSAIAMDVHVEIESGRLSEEDFNSSKIRAMTITAVYSGSRAEKEGFRPADEIVTINEVPVRNLNMKKILNLASKAKSGDTWQVEVRRSGSESPVLLSLPFEFERMRAAGPERGLNFPMIGIKVALNPSFWRSIDSRQRSKISSMRVLDVESGGAAERAGLKANDRILELGGLSIADISVRSLERLWALKQGDVLIVRVSREKTAAPILIKVTI